jgi:lipoate-protein ligase A
MTKDWRLLVTGPARGPWNMAVDEGMVEHIGRGESRPTLRLYAWALPCLSLGHAQPHGDIDLRRLKAHGWDMVRRPTGGRAILHTDELTYSVTTAPDEPLMAGSVLESYNRVAEALLEAVRLLGLKAEIKDTGSAERDPSNPVCFEVQSSSEITADGKKLIGSAQARRKEGILQHGSLPLTGDLSRITEALTFESEAARVAAAERLVGRATTVESALGRVVTWDDAVAAFATAFERVLELRFERCPLSESELRRADELVRDKYGHPSWMQRV